MTTEDDIGPLGSGSTRRPGVLIALHGHDDHPSTALEWGRRVAPVGWDVITPDAGVGSDGTRSWFSFDSRGPDSSDLAGAVQRIEDVAIEAKRTADTVVVAGFSQGAAVALATAWRGSVADQVIAICGFFPETLDTPQPDLTTGSRVVILSTEEDSEVPSFMGTDAASMFLAAGFDTTSHVLAGRHHVDANVAAVAHGSISATVRRKPCYSLALPVDRVEPAGEFTGVEGITELAIAYERFGFHAAYVTDHPAPDERWLAGGGHHALDPVGPLSVAAAVTADLRLHTNVFVLPYRNPFMSAKALSTLDVMSGGRVIAGVAAGYLRPEFHALGADFDARGARLEEALLTLPRIWSGGTIEAEGDGWESRSARVLPATHGGPPLWIGGNSRAAMRRSVTMAQGWSPMPTPAGSGKAMRTTEITDIDSLTSRLDQARALAEEIGRVAPLTICFVPFALGGYLADPTTGLVPMVDEIRELFDRGVDWFPLMVPGRTRSEVLENASQLSEALDLDRQD